MGAPEQELQIHPGTSFGSMGYRNRIHPVARGEFIHKAARRGGLFFCRTVSQVQLWRYSELVKIAPQELLGLLVATSFAAGLNVYAAVATLGLLGHAGVLPLPPALEIVSNWWVIGASGVLFLVEFF